jgi:hypothetical protein
MEIDTNINVSAVNKLIPTKRSSPAAQAVPADNSFASSAALEGALKSIPDVRAAAVDRARQLIADPNYPPAETISKLASFLAGKLTSDSASE